MSYTFRVVFDGVIAYVPERPFFYSELEADGSAKWEAEKDIGSLTILMPDLRRPGITPPTGSPPPYLPVLRDPHFPLLKFRLNDLRESSTRRVDLVCRDISSRDEEGLLFLRREQIRFIVEAENARKVSFAGWVPKDDGQLKPHPGNANQEESLWWLPDLSSIIKNGGGSSVAAHVDPRFLPSYRGPFPDGLVGRIEPEGGRLRVCDFNRDVDGTPLPWRFAKPSDAAGEGCWNRAIGNSLVLEFFDVRGDVRIQLRRLANEVIDREIVLGFSPGASRPVLEVEISNREPDFLFREEERVRANLPDMDFQAFYEHLSLLGDSRAIMDLPVPHPARMSFFGVVEKPCAGASMVMAPVPLSERRR